MKSKNPIKELFEKSGYKLEGDNRKRTIRNLNMLIESNLFEIKICEIGKSWIRDTTKPTDVISNRYNLIIKGGGWRQRSYTDITPYCVLQQFGLFLKNPEVKKNIRAYVNIPTHCHKCDGVGIIPQFSYYCSGVCFDCGGSGLDLKTKLSVELETPKTK